MGIRMKKVYGLLLVAVALTPGLSAQVQRVDLRVEGMT